MARRDRPITSAAGRIVRLGGLVGRVGGSMAWGRLSSLTRPADARALERSERIARNAGRIVDALGELKGAAMKLGQMASLHEGLLPEELTFALRRLQRQAPPIPFEVVDEELEVQIPGYRRLFAELEPEAFAAASIGQVHRGRLADGRAVAVKIQYPEIDRIVRADLVALRRLLGALFGLVSDMDFEPLWEELRARLLEEIDYESEAANLERFAALEAAHDPEGSVVVPGVVREATTPRVLTMDYVPALGIEEAAREGVPDELRSRWGRALFRLFFRGLFDHLMLHADPNAANFGFLPDGRVVAYDLGCVKRVPEELSLGYARVALAVVADDMERIREALFALGVRMGDGERVPAAFLAPYQEILREVARDEPPYRFGEDEALYERLFDHALGNLERAAALRFPHDVIFVDRTLGGLLGNLIRLGAEGPWGALVAEHARRRLAASSGEGGRRDAAESDLTRDEGDA